MTERKLQATIIEFLRSKGAYVMKNDATYRQGVPDLSFWHSDLSGFIEVKEHESSHYQPLQKPTIERLRKLGIFTEVIHNENWPEWKTNLDQRLKTLDH